MNLIRAVITTALFEFKRSASAQRIMLAVILAFFPPVMLLILMVSSRGLPITQFIVIILVGMVSLLAQLLWATPVSYTHLTLPTILLV